MYWVTQYGFEELRLIVHCEHQLINSGSGFLQQRGRTLAPPGASLLPALISC